MAKYDTETYCKMMAQGLPFMDALKAAGYKTDKIESAKRQQRNLEKDTAIQHRIKELKQYYQNNPERLSPEAVATQKQQMTAEQYLTAVLNDPEQEPKMRMEAAKALLPYQESKMAQKGKKEDALDTAKNKSETGRFATLSHQTDMFEGGTIQ